jgi:hypothetical protein
MGANAVTTVPVYTAGEVLTAADLNITNSGIPVFADSTARDAAFGGTGEKTLAEGQFAFLEDSNSTQFYDGSVWSAVAGGKVAQVVSVDKLDTFTTSTSSYVDVTGWAATITPTAATSKVLVFYTATTSGNQDYWAGFQIVRDSTAVGNGTATGSATAANKVTREGGGNGGITVTGMYLDSPATTSATTYKMQIDRNAGSVLVGASYFGQNNIDNFSYFNEHYFDGDPRMTDYALVLTVNYPGAQWAINANDYDSLQWFDSTPKPTQGNNTPHTIRSPIRRPIL